MDALEYAVVMLSQDLGQRVPELRSAESEIRPLDGPLADELVDAITDLESLAARLEGIASRWHYVER
jgi:hypothetical protein